LLGGGQSVKTTRACASARHGHSTRPSRADIIGDIEHFGENMDEDADSMFVRNFSAACSRARLVKAGKLGLLLDVLAPLWEAADARMAVRAMVSQDGVHDGALWDGLTDKGRRAGWEALGAVFGSAQMKTHQDRKLAQAYSSRQGRPYVRFLAAGDAADCEQAQALAGKVFHVGQEPTLPLPNCRKTRRRENCGCSMQSVSDRDIVRFGWAKPD
jgi:hypothetical protein